MKKISKNISTIVVTSLLLFACEVTNFDLQEDPNLLNPNSADPEYLLNEIQYLFQEIVEDMIVNTDDVMRYESMTDNYGDIVDFDVLNAEWERYYEALLISSTIDELAQSDPNLLYHNAINKLLMGYLTITLVDYNGSIPYTEAVNPELYLSPKLDPGVDLYKSVLADIDQAISDINAATFDVSLDLFYDNDKDKWIAFANSFKLRILIQSRLASSDLGISDLQSEINALLQSDIIDTPSEDFQYPYAAVIEPESRHPYYIRGYINGFAQYIGNYFMWMLKDSKTMKDPRIRYYLYRQSDIDPFSGPPYLACQGDPNIDYCYVGEHYWGLDHGEDRTGRGDNLLRTVYGIYPAGGVFDEDQFLSTPDTENSGGSGILPIITSSYIKFLSAESALVLGTNGNPANLLEEAIRASMDKVLNFGDVNSPFEPSQSDVDNYVAEVLSNYNAAQSDDERLDIIITEYYLAGYGNSIEAYNAYRRTGFPSNIQTPVGNDNPTFPRSFPYADAEVQSNDFISQKPNTDKVFWDKNPDDFIK